jgi:hypothetical protein
MNSTNKTTLQALGYSLAGAAAAAIANETAKRVNPRRSSLDLLSKRLHLNSPLSPFRRTPQYRTIAGNLLSTPLLSNILGGRSQKRSWLRGALFGLGAGLSSLALPRVNESILRRRATSKRSRIGNFGRLLMGGLAIAATSRLLNQSLRRRHAHPEYD